MRFSCYVHAERIQDTTPNSLVKAGNPATLTGIILEREGVNLGRDEPKPGKAD